MQSRTEWPSTVSDDDIKKLARQSQRRRGVVLNGPAGSGRAVLARALIERSEPGAAIREIRRTADAAAPVLEELAVITGEVLQPSASVEHLARRFASALPQRTGIVCDADGLDSFTLRVLTAIARNRYAVVVLLSEWSATAWEQSDWFVFSLPELTKESIARAVETRVGARPVDGDLRWMRDYAAGDYRSVRWLVDLCLLNDGVEIVQGAARFTLPPLDRAVVGRELERGLSDTDLGRVLALMPHAPLPLLRRLVGSPAIADAADAGVVIIDAPHGTVTLRSRAVALDVLIRVSSERIRVVLERIFDELDAAEVISPDTCASLAWFGARADLAVPARVVAPAVPVLLSAGDGTTPARLGSETIEALRADLVLGDVWQGDGAAAARRARELDGDADELLTAGLALVVGEARLGSTTPVAEALDEMITRLEQRADVAEAAVLTGYRAILRAQPDRPDWPAPASFASALTLARTAVVRALLDLLEGRPQHGRERLHRAVGSAHRAHPVDRYLHTIVGFFNCFTVPDLDGARDQLPAPIPIPSLHDASGITQLWALLALYEGNLAASLLCWEREKQRLFDVAPAGRAIIDDARAFCWLILGDAAAGATALQEAEQHGSASPLFSLVHRFAFAAASMNVTPPADAHARSLELLHEVGREAHESGILALPLMCTLGAIMVRRGQAQRLDLARAAAIREAAAHPFDGLFEIYSRLAEAQLDNDRLTTASLALHLHNEGLLLDSIGASTNLPGPASTVPQSLERAVTRIARWRPEQVAVPVPQRILTRRELEIAALVREGMTDRAIAEELHLSIRTVGVHVSRILRKLAVESRHQVDEVLRELEPPR